MNDFESMLATAMRDEAEEFSMNVDMHEGAQTLDARLDAADRSSRRSTWWRIGAAAIAAAAIVALVIGVRVLGPKAGGTVVAPPPPKVVHVTTTTLSPNVIADLPAWTASAAKANWSQDAEKWAQQLDCLPASCVNGQDHVLGILTPHFHYAPSNLNAMVVSPTYKEYVSAWDSLQANNYGTITARTTTTVAGHQAVLLSVDFTTRAAGLTACESDIQTRDECYDTAPGRSWRVAIVDVGGHPVVFADAMNTSNPERSNLPAELDAVLATVSFG
jgi:hypothetical protein